jgi:hypothetical protein
MLLVMLSPPEEPHLIFFPIFAIIWMAYGIALLLFDHAWAWWGSFVCSVIWLFVMTYSLWMDFAYMPSNIKEEGIRGFYNYDITAYLIMLAIAALSAGIVALLLHTRHQSLKSRINEWSVQFVQRQKRFLWIVTSTLFLLIFIIASLAWHYVF